jgi:hypothetical protein
MTKREQLVRHIVLVMNLCSHSSSMLSHSCRSNDHETPHRLTNELSLRGKDIFVASDDEEIDPTRTANKITAATFHRVKGLERRIVIAFSFAVDYFVYADPKRELVLFLGHFFFFSRIPYIS